MSGNIQAAEKEGIYKIIKNFPWWYSAVKWLTPITVGTISALIIAALTTGVIAVPAILSGLGALPVLYANLTAFGSFSLLAVSTMTAAMFTGGTTSLLTRIALFPMVESMAHDNYNGVRIFVGLTLEHQEKKVAELNKALVDTSVKYDEISQENGALKQQLETPAMIFSKGPQAGSESSNDEQHQVKAKSTRKHNK